MSDLHERGLALFTSGIRTIGAHARYSKQFVQKGESIMMEHIKCKIAYGLGDALMSHDASGVVETRRYIQDRGLGGIEELCIEARAVVMSPAKYKEIQAYITDLQNMLGGTDAAG